MIIYNFSSILINQFKVEDRLVANLDYSLLLSHPKKEEKYKNINLLPFSMTKKDQKAIVLGYDKVANSKSPIDTNDNVIVLMWKKSNFRFAVVPEVLEAINKLKLSYFVQEKNDLSLLKKLLERVKFTSIIIKKEIEKGFSSIEKEWLVEKSLETFFFEDLEPVSREIYFEI